MTEELDALLERLPSHHLSAEIPDDLRPWLLPIEWDQHKLWQLDLPQTRLAVDELTWHLPLPWWRRNDKWFQVTPWEFISRPWDHPEHANRVRSADLSFPAHVIRRHDRWLILDGIHRLARAIQLGNRALDVFTLKPDDLSEIVRPKPRP